MEYFDEILQIEYYKLCILVFELSAFEICEKKFTKVLLWNILIKFYAVKTTKAKGHYSLI